MGLPNLNELPLSDCPCICTEQTRCALGMRRTRAACANQSVFLSTWTTRTFMYNTSTIFFMEISFPCLLCGFAACSAPSGTSSANRACDARVLGARFMALLPGSDVRSHDGRSPSLSNGVEPVMSTARVRAVIPTYWTRRLSWKAAKEEAGKLRDAAAVGPVSSRRASGCRATAPVTVTRQLGPTLCRGRPRRGPFPFGER